MSIESQLKRTVLYNSHRQLGGKCIEFGGWEMPVQYSSIIEEHHAVRQTAGIFDIAHMGHVRCRGPQAADFLNYLLTNNLQKLNPGKGQYTLMCLPTGGVVDDLLVYQLADQDFWMIVNASRQVDDLDWMTQQLALSMFSDKVALTNLSGDYGAVAIQGPKAVEFIDSIFQDNLSTDIPLIRGIKKNQILPQKFSGVTVWVARTGYTGEDGFEIIAPLSVLEALWNRALGMGKPFGIKPAGLGARDTLRTEACLPLYGHELSEAISPLEAGLDRFVAMDKSQFVGRDALEQQLKSGLNRKLAAFRVIDKSPPPRPQYALWSNTPDRIKIGETTSGTQSPSLNTGIGLGLVKPEYAIPGTMISVEIRGRFYSAEIVTKPLYRKP